MDMKCFNMDMEHPPFIKKFRVKLCSNANNMVECLHLASYEYMISITIVHIV